MNNKKALVTGSSGMLGSVFAYMMKDLYQISVFPAGTDIADSQAVTKKLHEIKPDIIIHTAAYTDVDGCELNPQTANNVNVLGTKNLVHYCHSYDVKIIFISSTGLYGDGKEGNYSEVDEPSPTTVHHLAKLKAENLIVNLLSNYLILRVGWLYGGDKNHKNNFVYQRFLEAKQSKTIYADATQKGNPTSCYDVVKQAVVLLNNDQVGIFNCVNDGVNVSRYDYVKEITALFDLACKVEIAKPEFFKRVAPISCNESAVNEKLNSLGLNIMLSWKQSLSQYIDELKLKL